MEVGIRELRNNLSRYVEQVKAGSEIEVTEHGKLVARLIPVHDESKLERLIRLGVAHPPTRPKSPLNPPIKLASGVSISDLIIELRGSD